MANEQCAKKEPVNKNPILSAINICFADTSAPQWCCAEKHYVYNRLNAIGDRNKEKVFLGLEK